MLTMIGLWLLLKFMFTVGDPDFGEPRSSSRDWYNPHALRGGHNRRGDFYFRSHRSSRY